MRRVWSFSPMITPSLLLCLVGMPLGVHMELHGGHTSFVTPPPGRSGFRKFGMGTFSRPRFEGLSLRASAYGGGRAPGQPNMPSLDKDESGRWQLSPIRSSEARLTVIQVTDVYTLEHFASLRTLIQETKRKAAEAYDDADEGSSTVISMLTGDFLAPYLLSGLDKGAGMMNAIAKTPIDYLTWGNHEADIDHRTVCKHIKSYPGVWINTNMQDHEAMDHQKPFEIVEVRSPDGSNVRRIGLVGLLSDDPGLYCHFKAPGAFGGATIRDPWDTLAEYKELLEGEHKCDMVLPLQHTYVPDDHRTCEEFDVPVVLSGHDHHRVDEIVSGTRLLKPGLDAIYATALELSWEDEKQSGGSPTVKSKFVRCKQWEADEELEKETEKAYAALLPLRNTELARVPPGFEPLSSTNSRGRVCTMGRLICSLLKSSLNTSRRQRQHSVDAVLLMGGNIRGGTDYPEGSFFSLEALEAEVRSDDTIAVLPMPGWLLADGIEATHAGEPIPGWMQYDDGVKEEMTADGPRVTHVAGERLDRDRVYRVATKVTDLANGQSKPWTDYYKVNKEQLPPKGAYVNVHAELMAFFARNLFRKIWEAIGPEDGRAEAPEECDAAARLAALDGDGDGEVTLQDIQAALRDRVGLSVDDSVTTLAEFVYNYADTTGDGKVTVEDFEIFCVEMPQVYENQKWRLAFPRASDRSAAAAAPPAK